MTNYSTLRIIYLLDTKSTNFFLELFGKMINSNNLYFKIDGKRYIPHITIYNAAFPEGTEAGLVKILSRVSEYVYGFNVSVESFVVGYGYLGVQFVKNDEIFDVHNLILENVSPLRDGYIRNKYEKDIENGKYSQMQVEYIKAYGYPHVLDEYHPHLTLARFKRDSDAITLKKSFESELVLSGIDKVRIAGIGLATGGEHGTVSRIIKDFELKNEN